MDFTADGEEKPNTTPPPPVRMSDVESRIARIFMMDVVDVEFSGVSSLNKEGGLL